MAALGEKRILLVGDLPPGADDISLILRKAGYQVASHEPNLPPPDNLASCHLIIFEGSKSAEGIHAWCRQIRLQLAESFVPILLVLSDHSPPARLAALEGGADAYLLRPFAAGELLVHVNAFIQLKARHDRLTEKTVEVQRINQRLKQTYTQLDQELELARRIQRSFLPQSMPDLPRMKFATHYSPCGRVGGDFYDVFRLDENHVGFYIADAMGHGVPASLLTIFVKKGVHTKEIYGNDYRLVPPSEVLNRLNRDLIEQALSENPFITMVYVLLNHREGTLQFARSGHPYPLYLPRDGNPELWEVEGSLLGIFDTEFTNQERRLRPGDKLLLYTDGVDTALHEDTARGTKSLIACAAEHRHLPIEILVDRLARDLFKDTRQADDLTFLGVEME